MLHPVSITDSKDRNHGNREKYSGNARQFFTSENREDNGERVKMNSLTDQSWIDRIVFQDSQDSEKQQHQKSIEWTSVEHGQNAGHERDRNWSNERHKLEEACQHAHHQCARYTQEGKTDRTNHSDEQAGCQLCSNVSGERAVDVLEKLVAAPSPTTTWKHQQRRTAKTFRVLQQEKSENGNEDEPG